MKENHHSGRLAMRGGHVVDALNYFPPPERAGGWRWLDGPTEVRRRGGIDPGKLALAREYNAHFDASAAVVIIRHGYLVAEWYENSASASTRFDVWSCTKSFTSTAYGLLFEDSRHGWLPEGRIIDLESRAYDFIPEGHPLTDERKAAITFRHLLSMTSGIPGENAGIAAIPTRTGEGPFEAALGRVPTLATRWPAPRPTDTLHGDPGTVWDYSDPAFAHLSLAFANITGQEIAPFMANRVFAPIGIEQFAWDLQGIGAGLIGPHTSAHTGLHLGARELARFGYLMLRRGRWQGAPIVPEWWADLAAQPSQPYNPHYGLAWWTNAAGAHWPGLPADAFAAQGFLSNRCYVVPSLDLVVARVASGPGEWSEGSLIQGIVAAIVDE
jgi:CubicO group peptidase (beta-lactamase class C family)